MAGARAALWSAVKSIAVGTLISVTISDRYATVIKVQDSSVRPTFEPELGDCALVERRCLHRYDFSHGDAVVFWYPADHRKLVVNRLIALPDRSRRGTAGWKGIMGEAVGTQEITALFLWV